MKRILQVVWSGTGWDLLQPLLDHRLLPALSGLESRGVRGHLTALQPQVPIQLSHSILTGQPAWVHGLAHPLIVDHPDRIRCTTVADANEIGLPGCLAAREETGIWVGWSHLLPDSLPGQLIVHRGFASGAPAKVDRFALSDCRLHPDDITLEQLKPFFPELEAEEILADPMTVTLRRELAQAGTLQACATRLMHRSDWTLASARFEFGDRMVQWFGDCHPPLEQPVDTNRLQRYQHMVTGAYRLMDMMLDRLLQLAGPDATVLVHSDKGTTRSKPPPDSGAPIHQVYRADYDDRGFLLMSGERINPQQGLFAASILDIAPTLMALSGFRPDGLHGRVLSEAIVATSEEQPVAAYSPGIPAPLVSRALEMEIFEDIVAHNECPLPGAVSPSRIRAESDLFMALNMMQHGAAEQALELLERLLEDEPAERRYMLHRARCHLLLKQLDRAREWAQNFLDSGDPDLHSHLLLGRIALLQDDTDRALVHFFQAEQLKPDEATSHCQIGDAYRRAAKYEQARDAFQRALALDPMQVNAHIGLARIALKEKEYEATCEACLKALESDYRQPEAHFHLGVGLAKLQKIRESIAAFEACLRLQPGRKSAHQWLSNLYRFVDGAQDKAAMHKALSLS